MKSKMKPRSRSPSARDQIPTPSERAVATKLAGRAGIPTTVWMTSNEIDDVGPMLISVSIHVSAFSNSSTKRKERRNRTFRRPHDRVDYAWQPTR